MGTGGARPRPAATTVVAAASMLVVTAVFAWLAWRRVDGDGAVVATTRQLSGVVMLVLCAPYTAAALTLLARRAGGIHGAGLMTAGYGLGGIAAASLGALGGRAEPGELVVVLVAGLANLAVLALVLAPGTQLDLEAVQRHRHREDLIRREVAELERALDELLAQHSAN